MGSPSHDLSILTDPGCDLGHFMIVIMTHRAQVHIRGYGAVHIGGADFEARKLHSFGQRKTNTVCMRQRVVLILSLHVRLRV